MSKGKINALIEGAICSLLSIGVVILGIFFPSLSILLTLLAGVPMMYLGMRRGIRVLIAVWLVSVLAMLGITKNITASILTGVMSFLPGIVIGRTLRARKTFLGIILSGATVLLIGMVLQLVLINSMGGGTGIADMINGILDKVQTETNMALNMMEGQLAVSEQELQGVLKEVMDATRETIFLYLPAFLIGSAIVMSYLIFMIGVFLLQRLRPVRIIYQPFWAFCAPKSMCYLATILYLITTFSSDTTVWTAALKNVMILLYAYLTICGLSFLDYKLKKKISRGYGRMGIYVVGVFVLYPILGMLVQILSFLGMIDGVFGVRLREERVGDE